MLVGACGVCCLAAGAALLLVTPQAPSDFGVPPRVVVASSGPDALSAGSATGTAAVGASAARLVGGAAPVSVALPRRKVLAPVVPVGTDAEGGLAVPDPPTTVGWWTPSALPGGSGGTTVLAGHVDSRIAGFGAFSVLRDVEPGEPVTIRDTAGRDRTYRVVARREYVKAQLPVDDLFSAGGPPRLVLITCGGAFDRATRSYEDNVVVYAVPDGQA